MCYLKAASAIELLQQQMKTALLSTLPATLSAWVGPLAAVARMQMYTKCDRNPTNYLRI